MQNENVFISSLVSKLSLSAGEICDNLDNNCDSEVDEDNVCMRERRDLDEVECKDRDDCKWDDDECVEKDWSWWWDKYLKSVSSLIGRMF
jgi:hypothetical protein